MSKNKIIKVLESININVIDTNDILERFQSQLIDLTLIMTTI